MSKQYDKTNKGTLGKNKDKKDDKHPDYRGDINIDGKWYWLSGWLKENGSTGEKFFSLAVKPKEVPQEVKEIVKPDPKREVDDFDDGIPF